MYQELVRRAYEAAQNAYAPYSGFRVGAAVLLQDGTIITGSNQENVSFPLCICAERVALSYAQSQYPNIKVECIAVVSPTSNHLITPCGACRGVMSEIAIRQGSSFRVLCANKEEITEFDTDSLMPFAFNM